MCDIKAFYYCHNKAIKNYKSAVYKHIRSYIAHIRVS